MENGIFTPTGMLSDTGIRQYFKHGIDIYTDGKDGLVFDLDKQLHVGSVDLRFRHLYNRFNLEEGTVLSYELLEKHKYTKPYELSAQEKLKIYPGEIILTTTLEIVNISEEFAAMITGRSSIARLGIMVHCCQEFIHPGHGQAIPLQIVNLSPYPVELDLEVPICQIVFFKLATPASSKYTDRVDAKYSDELNSIESKIYQEVSSQEKGKNESPKRGRLIKWIDTIKKFLATYISPFLPGAISYLVITPLLAEYIINKTIGDLQISLQDIITKIPAAWCTAFVFFVIYIFSKRGNDK